MAGVAVMERRPIYLEAIMEKKIQFAVAMKLEAGLKAPVVASVPATGLHHRIEVALTLREVRELREEISAIIIHLEKIERVDGLISTLKSCASDISDYADDLRERLGVDDRDSGFEATLNDINSAIRDLESTMDELAE